MALPSLPSLPSLPAASAAVSFFMLNFQGVDVQMSAETTLSHLGRDRFAELLAVRSVLFCDYVIVCR